LPHLGNPIKAAPYHSMGLFEIEKCNREPELRILCFDALLLHGSTDKKLIVCFYFEGLADSRLKHLLSIAARFPGGL
jgi:hypothetical protein